MKQKEKEKETQNTGATQTLFRPMGASHPIPTYAHPIHFDPHGFLCREIEGPRLRHFKKILFSKSI